MDSPTRVGTRAFENPQRESGTGMSKQRIYTYSVPVEKKKKS